MKNKIQCEGDSTEYDTINSGDRGSASNSGEWGVSMSNAFGGTVKNKVGCYSMITEFVLDNYSRGQSSWKELNKTIIKQNAKLIKFTAQMDGKEYTLFKNEIFEVITCDNIRMIVLDSREFGGYKVINGINYNLDTWTSMELFNKQVKLNDIPKLVVVEKDGVYSHGSTVEEAIADFRYKIGNRDTTAYEYLRTEKGKVKTDDLIKAYRVITGACMYGTKSFVEGLGKVKDEYTITEAIDLLSLWEVQNDKTRNYS